MSPTRRPRSLPELTRSFAESQPGKTALLAGDRRISYAELDAESSRVAQALLAEGVEPGDRVAFLDKNVPEYFTLLVGAAKARAVSVAVNWRLAPPEMAYILNHARVKTLVVGREFLGHVDQMELETRPASDPSTTRTRTSYVSPFSSKFDTSCPPIRARMASPRSSTEIPKSAARSRSTSTLNSGLPES